MVNRSSDFAEGYALGIAHGREQTAPKSVPALATAAVAVLTEHELSPSTRDLLTLDGIARSVWPEESERLELLDTILAEYEAQAVAHLAPGERYAAIVVRAIVGLRVQVQQRKEVVAA